LLSLAIKSTELAKGKSTPAQDNNITPLMQQYFQMKSKHPDAIMLFRVGDFYETFGQDAILTAQTTGIVLTKRNNGGVDIELAGFPHHSLDVYLPKLVKAGHRVAICEQMEKPGPQKKIVRRGVTEIITPGLATDDKLLDHKSNNYLAALYFSKRDDMGMAFLDISTGEFLVCEGDAAYADKLLQSLKPTEILFSKDRKKDFAKRFGDKFYTYALDEWVFTLDFARQKLIDHFEVQNLKGFGIEELELAPIAAGAILHYLESTENKQLKHINAISRILPEKYVWLDRFTIRNLELIYSQHDSGASLLKVLDRTVSPMGSRLMKKWVILPLRHARPITERLDVVSFFLDNPELCMELEQIIRHVGDLERLISKAPMGKINPREMQQLYRALTVIEPLKSKLLETRMETLINIADGFNPCHKLKDTIAAQLVEDPPVNVSKGGVIASGFSEELDQLRRLINNSREVLLEIQAREIQRTGINSLKIGFNAVFGYYLEVTNKYKDQAPDDWIRKQTLTNGERYITEELKDLETKILGAEDKILELESKLFDQLVFSVADYVQPIQHNAQLIARIDCLLAFARVAEKHRYCRPEINDSLVIDIKGGRHPVIEQQLPLGESYVPNDVYLDSNQQQILLITGPNMAGKSALLRQTALICLMAQMGCFVPASAARIGLLDKVFTRVGASDNISSGESTFMVEMNETASIMNNISDRSLLLLDEIGRGTSTFDGVSIAWAIAEYLHQNGSAKPKTLFATHYHELNELSDKFERIRNFHVSVREQGNKVIFLRKLTEGGSHHSFGIHVARMAGMPRAIVERAAHILAQLELKSLDEDQTQQNGPASRKAATDHIQAQAYQLSIFETVDPVAGNIKQALLDVDLNRLTPIECMLKLNELRKMLDD
jgi:DNA mismatch repair protein MutS